MKTSNYIIISFFIFLFGGVFVLFLAAKVHERHGNEIHMEGKEKVLEPFSTLVAEPGAKLFLRIGDHPKMLCSYEKPDTCNFPPFEVRNDTLFVFYNPRISKDLNINVYGKGIKAIVGKKDSYINLQEFWADSLIIKLNYAKLDAFFDKTKNLTATFSILAEESTMNLTNANIERIDIQLSKSKIQAWNNSISSLYGTLKNHSHIQVKVMEKVNVEVDSTSNYNILK